MSQTDELYQGVVTPVVGDQNHWKVTVTKANQGIRYLDPQPSLKLRNHSPTGFAWGYNGSGPAQLALAVLLDYTGDPDIAQRWYQDFKSDIIANFHQDKDWTLTGSAIRGWLASYKRCPALLDVCERFEVRVITVLDDAPKSLLPLTVYYLGHNGESGAGIHPFQMTPCFASIQELEKFCLKHHEKFMAVPDEDAAPDATGWEV